MKKIKCPLPAKTYGAQNNLPKNEFTIESDDSDVHQFLGEYQPGMDMEESMDSEDEHLATSIITLTKSHIVSNNLNLPTEFVRKAFAVARPKEITIKDEEGRTFICRVSKGRRRSEANLSGQWKQLCITNGLHEDSVIEIIINPDDSGNAIVYVIDV